MNESTKITIKNVRLSYAHIWHPEASLGDPSRKKYSCTLLIPKDHPQVADIKAAIKNAAQANIGLLGGKLTANLKQPLRDGDIDKANSPEFANSFFVNASSNKQPGIGKARRGQDGKPLRDAEGRLIIDLITDEQEVYSGCFCHVSVNFFAFSQAGNRGIACGLNNILKAKDGDFLGGRVSLQSEFGGSISDDDLLDEPEDEEVF